jgi:hypothetical protein
MAITGRPSGSGRTQQHQAMFLTQAAPAQLEHVPATNYRWEIR